MVLRLECDTRSGTREEMNIMIDDRWVSKSSPLAKSKYVVDQVEYVQPGNETNRPT